MNREAVAGGRGFPAAIAVAYFLSSALFVALYTVRTVWILPWGMNGFTYGEPPYPFRYRVLVPWMAKNLAAWTHAPLALVYAGLATLAVFGLLLAYDRYLALFTRRDTARLLAFGILYPLAWNYCGLNLMYFPFDLPGVFFFTAALLALTRGRWIPYYALFAVATVNRETTWFFTVVFLCVWAGRMPVRALVAHALAQAAIWIGLKVVLYKLYAGAGQGLFANMTAQNLATFRGMLTLQGTGLKDWAKLLLMFGSLWLALPFVLRGRPAAVRRALLAAPAFILPMLIVGTIDEARVYGELIPLVATPALLYAASRLEARPA